MNESTIQSMENKQKKVLEILLKTWMLYPHQRLCQLICNATWDVAQSVFNEKGSGGTDPFYVTDEQLQECLEKFSERVK